MRIFSFTLTRCLSTTRNMCSSSASNCLPKYAANSQPYTVFIEGNIGSGKTTYLNHFKKFENDICLITEPVEKWRNLHGFNLLDLMYKEPQRWAMPFQSYVTLTMLDSHTYHTKKRIKIMERSLYSARYCFVNNMHRNNILDDGMFYVLQEWYKFIEKTMHIQADLIVYLRASPEVCHERIKQRARSEESCVPLEYLQQLHESHENWLIHRRIGNPKTKVHVIDANVDLEHIGEQYKHSETHVMNSS